MAHKKMLYEGLPGLEKLFFLLSFVLVFSLIGCDKRNFPVEEADKKQILLLGNGADPADLDPQITTGISEQHIHLALFEGLVSYHPKTLEIVPAVAEHWDISENWRVYTFYLRKDAQWSNGDFVTASDFVFSYQRMLSAGLGAEYASMLFVIENAEAFYLGRIKDFSAVGVRALASNILQIRLHSPIPYFLSMITHHAWFPVHAPTILKYGAMDERGTRWTRPGNHIGNGPFKLKSWEINHVITVVKNDYYWDASTVRLRQIHFYPIEKSNIEERAFRAKQLHITDTVPPHKVQEYRDKKFLFLQVHPALGTYYYLFNVNKKPFDDARVRRALSITINRRAIVEKIIPGGQAPAYNFTPPQTGGYTCETSYFGNLNKDIKRARQLLAQAGYPDGKNFPTIKLLYNTSESHRFIAEAIQDMWKKSLNINVILENQEWKVYLNSRKLGNFEILRAGWIGDYNDPSNFLELWTKNAGNNHSGWNNAAYDSLLEKAMRTINQQKRFEYFQKAEAILLDEMPVIPIFFYVSATLIQPSVKNWYPNILNHHPYKYVYLEP
jgi:oligopeptide transport system substrate-binding protein